MTVKNWGPVSGCMRKDVTEIDGRMDVMSALKLMKEVGDTSLIVKRRDENDEYGMLLFSDIAKKVIAKNRAPSSSSRQAAPSGAAPAPCSQTERPPGYRRWGRGTRQAAAHRYHMNQQ